MVAEETNKLSNRVRTTSLDFGYLDQDVANELNTYRTWNEFTYTFEPSEVNDKGFGYKVEGKAVKSLFSNIHGILLSSDFAKSYNRPLLDTPGTRIKQRKQTSCTIRDLVEGGSLMGRQIYNYSDFAYCRYLGKIPNNYLITLRRFPNPCGDHIDYDLVDGEPSDLDKKLQGHMPDMGRLVTWMGTPGNEMSSILKYSYHVNWTDLDAKIEEHQTEDSTSPLASIFNAADSTYGKQVQQGIAGAGLSGLPTKFLSEKVGQVGVSSPTYSSADWQQNYDQNKVYGPLDVINKTKIRQQGMELDQKFTLTFDYQMRSYDGINGKAAFLDLLSNILCVTYTTGKFWGGGYHFYGAHTSNIFSNLPIFAAAERGELNNFAAIGDAISESWSAATANFRTDWKGELKKIASNMLGMLMGGVLNKLGRPQKMALNSLISPAPTGTWHLTIGNPKAPIMEIGNLCMTDATIEHYGPLGLDDFPTGLKVTVTLEPGKSRDIVGIEQMYQRGDSRIYAPMSKDIMRMYETATSISSPSVKLNTTIPSIESGEVKPDKTDNVLIKYFGDTDRTRILVTAKEACFGSKLPVVGNKPNATNSR